MGKDKRKRFKKEPKKEAEKREPRTAGNQNGTTAAASAGVAINGKGCLCPVGCIVGKDILINDVLGLRAANATGNKYVKVFCTNAGSGKCNLVPFMHDVCFNKWEEILVRQLRMRNLTRDWNDDKVKRHLWLADGGTFCHRSRKCSCGGFITRVHPEDEELPKPTEKAQQKAVKAATDPEGAIATKKKLPPLVTIASKLGGASIYKTCPGYGARGLAAPYASNDYANRADRTRNRRQREAQEEQEKKNREAERPPSQRPPTWSSLLQSIVSDDEEVESAWIREPGRRGGDGGGSGRTSFSSSLDEGFWARPVSPMQPVFRQSEPGTSGISSAWNGSRKSAELIVDFEDEEDEIITEEELVNDIRDLLSSLGGQLDLDDPLLTNIVSGRASGDLMLAICDYGGLAPWLSKHSEFDVNESRVRLCRNTKRDPAHLSSTGTIQVKTESTGTIFCNSYECTVFFDEDLDGFEDLRKGDIVKVDALECREPIDGHRWKATTVTLLQRDSPAAILNCLRQSSLEAKEQQQQQRMRPLLFPKPLSPIPLTPITKENLKAKLAAALAETAHLEEDADDPVTIRRGPLTNMQPIWPMSGHMGRQEVGDYEPGRSSLKTEEAENGGIDSPISFDEKMEKLTAEYMPATMYGESSEYGDVLAMLKSWDI